MHTGQLTHHVILNEANSYMSVSCAVKHLWHVYKTYDAAILYVVMSTVCWPCSAVGDGCALLSDLYDPTRQTVNYFIQGGVFYASTMCRPRFTFSELYRSATVLRCSNSVWSSHLSQCIGKRLFLSHPTTCRHCTPSAAKELVNIYRI